MDTFSYRFHLGMSSVDHAGVIFFPELFRHAHDAYEAFMTSLGQDLSGFFAADLPAIPVVHAECDFQRPMRHGDHIEVKIRVEHLGETSMTMDYRFLGPEAAVCARCKTVHACIDKTGKRPVPVPAALRETLLPYVS